MVYPYFIANTSKTIAKKVCLASLVRRVYDT